MDLLSAAQARELDRLAIEELGIPQPALMEAAGLSLALAMEKEWGVLAGRRVALLCGKGNNGADGMVLARHLVNMGASPVVMVAGAKGELKGAAKLNDEVLARLGLKNVYINNEGDLALAKAVFENSDLAVDALCGTGFKGALTGLPAALVVAMNAAGKPVVSVDLPSGMDADSGAVQGACAYAALTVTFSAPKRGLLQEPGRSYAGKLVAADIGIPAPLMARLGPLARAGTPDVLRPLLPGRHPRAHKKNAGSLLIVAGSRQYAGAAILCARAAFASGAGFVRLLVPAELIPMMQAAVPEAVVHAASEKEALGAAQESQAAVLGPGLGRAPEILKLAAGLYASLPLPAVVDGDALQPGLNPSPAGPRLLTPHEGEMARLGGLESIGDRWLCAGEFAARQGIHLLLKGPGTIIASPEGRLGTVMTGSAALASAGTGDVLSGLCGALLAQGLRPFEAGWLGAYLHGLAADLRTAEKGETGLTASELIQYLPLAFSQVRGKA